METASIPADLASVTSSGVRLNDLYEGHGDKVKTGDLILIDLVARTEDGNVFIDTRESKQPLAFEVGTTNKFVTKGLSQVVELMTAGDMKLAVVPPNLGYGSSGVSLPQGTVPPNSKLFYEVEVLRCQRFTLGLACCTEASFPCIGKDKLKNAAASASAAP